MARFRLTTSSSAWACSGSKAHSAADASSVARNRIIANRSNLNLDIGSQNILCIAALNSTVQSKRTQRSQTMTLRQSSVKDGSGDRCLGTSRSEEHTSELQSLRHLVCRLLLEIRRAHV